MSHISGTGTLNFRGAELAVNVTLADGELTFSGFDVATEASIVMQDGSELPLRHTNAVAVRDANNDLHLFTA